MIKTFIDCGAYSAWKKNECSDLKLYIAFIKRFGAFFDSYSNLDVIAGRNGQYEFDPRRNEAAARQSYQNLQRMKDAGLNPIPVFHQGEDFSWLQRSIDDGERYIGFSPYKRQGRIGAMAWLDQCFDVLTENGRPLVQTHGFGVTSPVLLLRYPFRTVDSSRWALASGNGMILVPPEVDGRFDYSAQPTIIPMTDRVLHYAAHVDQRIHADIERMRRFLDQEVGITEDEARYSCRRRALITYFKGLEQAAWDRQASFLHHPSQRLRPADWPFEIALVSDVNKQEHELLVEMQVRRRLLSFYKLKGMDDAKLERFFTGR
jgi:hypothetical protein